MISEVQNIDRMDFLSQFPDKFFDWAIDDPPYFKGPEKRKYYGQKVSNIGVKRIDYPVTNEWVVPGKEYFDELIRVSKNQIVWGVNYYDYVFGSGRIVWDKVNFDSSFSDCELAYCSAHDTTRLFRFMWNGMLQGKSVEQGAIMQGNKTLNEKRIHPTQKPIPLYQWQYKKYTNPGDKIVDCHLGSGSNRIAAHLAGCDFYACELDKTHFDNQNERFKKAIAMPLFDDREAVA
jgi:site-specific DNA-methyltransferase (adenine-specific)